MASALSALLPGLGQAYNGERQKAASALAMSLGVLVVVMALHVVTKVTFRSEIDTLMPVYALIWLPAVTDAWRVAKGGRTRLLGGESRIYVLAMISCLGPLALPLLWQSPRFGPAGKIVWTAIVVLAVVAALWVLVAIGPAVDELLREIDALQEI